MTLEGRILSPRGFVRGRLHFSERILAVEEAPVEGPYILPGFLDLHVHGGLGADAMEGKEAVLRMARFHLQHGTTGLLARAGGSLVSRFRIGFTTKAADAPAGQGATTENTGGI